MARKIILSFTLGFFLTGGFVVLAQQNAHSQNQSRSPAAFFRDVFGIGEPAPAQNPHGQQQSGGQPQNNQGRNNVHAQQAQPHQQPTSQQAHQPSPAQRPATAQTNTQRPQNNPPAINPEAIAGAATGTSRVPARGTTFTPNSGESPRIAGAVSRQTASRESEEATINQLNRIRSTIFEGTVNARELALERKEGPPISRNSTFDSLETDGLASSSKVGISSSGNRSTFVAESEEEVEAPATKNEPAQKPALPKTVSPSSDRQKPAVVESGKTSTKNTKSVVLPEEEEEFDDEDATESLVVSTTEEDEEDFIEEEEVKVAEEAPKVQVESVPRKISSSPVRPRAEAEKTETSAGSQTIKSNVASGIAVLDVEMTGPPKPVVGQELAYQFTITNRGSVAAESVVLLVELPVWAEIQSFDPKVGATSVEPKDEDTNLVNWNIDRLGAGESQQLVVHLIPRQRKVFTMSWNHKFKPPVSQMIVDVLEPKIEMSLEGPLEMLWGTKSEFRLRIQNTGNGDAEDVYLTLLDEQGESETEPMGTLLAGQEKLLTIEVTAKQQEKFNIFVQASSPFGLQAEARRTVKILRPKLTTLVEAPEMQFVDNQSEYRIVVQNTGTAPAQNIEIKAMIPAGVKYVSHQGNGRVLSTLQNQVVWTVDTIPVGEEFVCALVCEMKRAGTNQVSVSATERTGLNTTAVASTFVEAIADLVLKLENPQRPIEVGKAAYHTITITNRGSKPAENVEVIAAFAGGVTPLDVEGSKAKINKDPLGKNGGQVFFDKIPVINPKQTVVLKIKAKSDVPGNKRVRAEMSCPGIDIHSIQEESTRYYSNVLGENSKPQSGVTGEETQRISLNRPTPTPVQEESNLPFFEPLPENFENFAFEDF